MDRSERCYGELVELTDDFCQIADAGDQELRSVAHIVGELPRCRVG